MVNDVSFAAGVALLLAASVAVAAPARDTALLIDERVIVVAAARERGARVEAALRARGLRLVEDAERTGLDGVVERTAVGDRERLRSLLLSARSAWRQLDLEGAAALVDEAITEAVRLERPEDHTGALVDALLFRSSLALGRGGDDDARRDLILASRLEPGREGLDAALHPPSLTEAFAAARAAARAAGAHVVVMRPRVVGGPDGVQAEVIIDGAAATPRDGLLELSHGLHLVTVRAPGCRGVSRLIDVDGADVAVEDVLITEAAILDRQSRLEAVRTGDIEALRPLRLALGVDILISLDALPAVVAQRGEGAAVVVDVAPGASAAQIADAVLQAVAPATTRPDEAPANDLWWWSVGAGGVAAVIGVAALSTWVLWPGEAPPPPPRPVPVTCCGL
jgi:hypothetical protein